MQTARVLNEPHLRFRADHGREEEIFCSPNRALPHPNAQEPRALGTPVRLRSGLRQYGVCLILRLPSPYPSSRFARLGNGLGYYLPRLPALHSGRGWCFVAPGCIFERGTETGNRTGSHIIADIALTGKLKSKRHNSRRNSLKRHGWVSILGISPLLLSRKLPRSRSR